LLSCLCEPDRAKQSPILREIAHLHCTTPALAGSARERSAVQVSAKNHRLATTSSSIISDLDTPNHIMDFSGGKFIIQ
jgi:hypothetical protein